MNSGESVDRSESFSRLGSEIYERAIRPALLPDDEGKFVAIDIDSGQYEIDEDDYAATERLLVRRPDARIWLARAGERAAYRVGGRSGLKDAR
jgi:hypothetical protein